MYDTLSYHLDEFGWQYVWIVGTTDSAATPHLHVYLWVRDADDKITVDHARPAVESFVRNTTARPEDHPVVEGQSDAANVYHDPPKLDLCDDQALHIYQQRGERGFRMNTRGFAYLMNQRADWVLEPIAEGESGRGDVRDVALDGAAIAWASANKWINSSKGINLTGGARKW